MLIIYELQKRRGKKAKKVFDSAEQNTPFSVSHPHINIFQDSLEDIMKEIMLFGAFLMINIRKGIKQGDICLPKIFGTAGENPA